MKHAIIYCRFSPRPNAEECKSNEKQEERCRAFCERRLLVPVAVHKDVAVSGKVFDRPGLASALAALSEGMVLVCDSSDRLARDMLVALTIRHKVKQAGATIEFADGSPIADTPEGELFANILAAFAAYERSKFALRTKSGLARKKANGEWLGRSPVGWRIDSKTKKLRPDEYEQQAILVIHQHNADGRNAEEIAKLLTKFYGLFRGKAWSPRTVRKILSGGVFTVQ